MWNLGLVLPVVVGREDSDKAHHSASVSQGHSTSGGVKVAVDCLHKAGMTVRGCLEAQIVSDSVYTVFSIHMKLETVGD
jgi:hypothetical protein